MAGVIIIGTGASASLVAAHYMEKGEKVTMLERGIDKPYAPPRVYDRWSEGWTHGIEDGRMISRNAWTGLAEDPELKLKPEGQFDDLCVIENVNQDFGFHYNMRLGYGGSSAIWSGRVWRFYDSDFETKTRFGFGLDWPVTADDMAPFYDQAEQILSVSGPRDGSWPFRQAFVHDAFDMTFLDDKIGGAFGDGFMFLPSANAVQNIHPRDGGCVGAKTCVSFCPSNALYRHYQVLENYRDKPGFEIIGDRIVAGLGVDENGAINQIHYVARETGEGVLDVPPGTQVFLCCNTVENLRILLNSERLSGQPVANSSGLLGAYFASHGATVREIVMNMGLSPGLSRPSNGVGLPQDLGDDRARVGSHMLEISNFNHRHGSSHRAFFKKRLESGLWGRELYEAAEYLDRSIPVAAIFEIEMRERNRIRLSEAADDWGIPIAQVDFELSERDQATFEYLNETMDSVAEHPDCDRVGAYGFGLNGNHPMGGYISAKTKSEGVTDRTGRTFDHPNLYVMGGGLFASTSCFNPTLTITANTLRCLDEIA
ncbi:MAG: GMC oxidoreductase [Pseudomonadota bacterium]